MLEVLIGLFLTNVILILLGIRQRKAFRQTEARLRDALFKKIEEINTDPLDDQRVIESALFKKIEEVNLLQCRHHQTVARLQDELLEKIEEVEHLLKQYRRSTLFDYQSPWWQDYSWLYRHVCGWQCEECLLSLDVDRQYLHTHHLYGTQHNDPNDLKALCIACHSKQPGLNHHKLTATEDYHEFMEKYGKQWRLLIAS